MGMIFQPNIIVMGIGGAGCNAVNNMIDKQLAGVKFIAANTDAQSLLHSKADHKIQLGIGLTKGLGSGGDHEVGRDAARESANDIKEQIQDCHMLFITAGMGGGTGTGATPVVAKIAKEMGILTIGVITKPFAFEGRKKMETALDGIRTLRDYLNTLIIVPNQNLMHLANEKTTNREAMMMADDVLYNGVAGISDIIVRPGHINLDLADLRGVMTEMGRAVLGTGEASGKNRAILASEKAIKNPMLEHSDIMGAKQLLINISGGDDLTLFETEAAINHISHLAGGDCMIHIGSAYDPALDGKVKISVVATGVKGEKTGFGKLVGQKNETQDNLASIKNTALNPFHRGENMDNLPSYMNEPTKSHNTMGDSIDDALPQPARFASQPTPSPVNHNGPSFHSPFPGSFAMPTEKVADDNNNMANDFSQATEDTTNDNNIFDDNNGSYNHQPEDDVTMTPVAPAPVNPKKGWLQTAKLAFQGFFGTTPSVNTPTNNPIDDNMMENTATEEQVAMPSNNEAVEKSSEAVGRTLLLRKKLAKKEEPAEESDLFSIPKVD